MSRPKRKTKRGLKMKPRIAFQIPEHGDEVLIAEERWAVDNHRINLALETSRTWGEFRRQMPRAAYGDLMKWQFDNPDDPRPRPKTGDSFNAFEQVYGYDEGDYPEWSKQHIERVVPKDLLWKYGKPEANMINGSWWTIELDKWPDLKRELEQRGFLLVERSDLTHFR